MRAHVQVRRVWDDAEPCRSGRWVWVAQCRCMRPVRHVRRNGRDAIRSAIWIVAQHEEQFREEQGLKR